MTAAPRSVAAVVCDVAGAVDRSDALTSIAAQSAPPDEVVLVVTAPLATAEQEDARRALGGLPLHVEVTDGAAGLSGAVAAGVRAASATWVAPLVVPDTWVPRRLEATLALAEGAGARAVLCRAGAWHLAGDPSPRRLPAAGEPLDAFLLVGRSAAEDASVLSPSTLLAHREVLLDVPPRPTPARHLVADWLLRAGACAALRPVWHPDLLVVSRVERRDDGSEGEPWETVLRWLEDVRPYVSRRAYAGCVLGEVAAQARAAGDVRALRDLPRLARRRGEPRVRDLVGFASLLAARGGGRGGPPLLRQALRGDRRRR